MPIQFVPQSLAEGIAAELLQQHQDLTGFVGAHVSRVRPLRGSGGDEVRFYEVKFSRDDEPNAGYAILAATTEALPVMEFTDAGPTPSEQLGERSGRDDLSVRYLNALSITAEDDGGNLVELLGDVFPASDQPAPGERLELRSGDFSELDEHPEMVEWPIADELDVEMSIDAVAVEEDEPLPATKFRVSNEQYQAIRQRPPPDAMRARAGQAWAKLDLAAQTPAPQQKAACVWQVLAAQPYKLTHYSQLKPKQKPNTTKHWSGCGPTAWMNRLGYFDRNRTPELLGTSATGNDATINALTMAMHGHLGTKYMAGQGYTGPSAMFKGAEFARRYLRHHCSWSMRQDWFNTDESWVYVTAHEMIAGGRPFIVGYYSDMHYTICSKVKECKTHGTKNNKHCFLYLPEKDKWIPKETIFAVYGLYNMWSLRRITKFVNPQELVVQLPGTHGRMYVHTGIARAPSGLSGRGGDWFRDHLSFEIGKKYAPGEVADVSVTVWLASIGNAGDANNAGWALDRCKGTWNPETGRVRVDLDYALRDSDGTLYRLAYNVTIRAST